MRATKTRVVDELYERQSRMLDIKDRLPLVRQIEKRVLGRTSLSVSGSMVAAHRAAQQRLKGWKIGPSHYVNQDLRDVWLAQ